MEVQIKVYQVIFIITYPTTEKKFLKKNYTSYTRQRNLLNLLGVSGVGSVVFFQKLFFVVV